jgi:flavin reductase
MTDPLDDGFRKAMRTLTSAVTIISTECGSRRFGMTATAVTSLSMAPPSLLACVNMSASIHAPLLESGAFCVNVLHANQVDVAEAFSSKKIEDRFSAGEWSWDGRAPYLVGAQANVSCEIEASYVHGTHRIFIGRVLRVRVREQVNPLIYQDGRYTVGLGDGVDWVVPSV